MKPIISVEGLGKKYVIQHEGQTHYKSLREEIFQLPRKLLRRQENKEEFWALKDVSFDIMPGDRVGIIGRNGAGKSTLLKLLSRITEPSAGRITMRGRVASLLEVGTGFHPELTGRENIYLNGAILGMSRGEVRSKFDEIVDFSGVDKFLDTPVKRYSSGMYVRLAFAVAAHLEPEILVVDEVLAVGDGEFQKKCLNKMENVSNNEGRTVLFVSHSMGAIQRLCGKGFFLAQGKLELAGPVGDVLDRYHQSTSADKDHRLAGPILSTSLIQIDSLLIEQGGNETLIPISGRRTRFALCYTSHGSLCNVRASLHIENSMGVTLFSLSNYWHATPASLSDGSGKIIYDVSRLPLSKDKYNIYLELKADGFSIERELLHHFYIEQSEFFSSHVAGNYKLGVQVEHFVSFL